MPELQQGSSPHGTGDPPPSGDKPATAIDQARQRAGLNTVANFASFGVTIIVAFLIWPLQVHALGDDAYGLWAFLQQLIAYSLLLDFGVRIAVMRNVARLQAAIVADQESPDSIGRLVSTAVISMLVPAAVVMAAGIFAAFWIPVHLGLHGSLIGQAHTAIILATIAIAIAFPGNTFTSCLVAVSRYDLMNLRIIAVQLLRAVLIWYFLTHGYGLVALAAIFLVVQLAGESAEIYFSARHVPGFRIRIGLFDRESLRFLLSFGFYAFLLSIAHRLLYLSDNVVVGAFAGAAAVTFYSVAGNLADYFRNAISNVTKIFGPMIMQLDAMGDGHSLRAMYLNGSRIGMVVAVPGVIFLTCAGRSFLTLWMDPHLAARSTATLVVLSLAALAVPFNAMYTHVLYATDHHRANAYLAMVEGVFNLGLSIALIHSYGITGVALGSLIPTVVMQMIVVPIYTSRLLGTSYIRYGFEVFVRPAIAAVPIGAVMLVAERQGRLGSWLALVGSGFLVCVAYFASAWLLVLNADERRMVDAQVRRRWTALRLHILPET